MKDDAFGLDSLLYCRYYWS